MLESLKEQVYLANLELVKQNLVIYTWGNVSGIDREKGLVVIKPSGVGYDAMTSSDMVVVDLDGKVVEGELNPSSDTPTHVVLYKAFPNIGGVVHTHSTYATAWSQAGRSIEVLGTTHADYFHGNVPCTGELGQERINGDYELETGKLIAEAFEDRNPDHTPAALVKNHGPFAWGRTPSEAVYHAKVLEEVAKMNFICNCLNPNASIDPSLVEKHFMRKHGPNAYYGQKKK